MWNHLKFHEFWFCNMDHNIIMPDVIINDLNIMTLL